MASARVRVGVSSCLLGERVRWDGGHKRDEIVLDLLGRHFEYVSACPEMDAGMGSPRPTLGLFGTPRDARLETHKLREDLTRRMRDVARRRAEAVAAADVHGYILKKDSPSCGMAQVRVWGDDGVLRRSGTGLFADELMTRLPRLPVTEEGRLRNGPHREHFVERVFAHERWARFAASDVAARDLVTFHAEHKMQLLAHDPEFARELGRVVAGARDADVAARVAQYGPRFLDALAKPATRGTHANALEHLLGHVGDISSEARRDIVEAIHAYRRGLVPLVVPARLIRHHIAAHDAWARAQRYLQPYPDDLPLRSFA